jgi:hypothetical protein
MGHYHRIVVALSDTIHLMQETGEVIGQRGGWPVEGNAQQASECRASRSLMPHNRRPSQVPPSP